MVVNNIIIKKELLRWYDLNRRILPWRVRNNKKIDPYKVLISEIMLQQTTVNTVINKYIKFLDLWPNLNQLSKTSESKLLKFWSGLGYYRRATNLLKCAKIIKINYNSKIPNTYKELIQLPGIGEYTANAILGIAFNKSVMPVDANIERIIARIYSLRQPLAEEKKNIINIAKKFISKNNSSNLIQAFMDYGSAICLPRNPKCKICKIQKYCLSYKKGITNLIPKKIIKTKKPLKYTRAYVILNNRKEVLVRKRPSVGMLASMLEIPNDKWVIKKKNLVHDKIIYKMKKEMTSKGLVEYSFSHFNLKAQVFFLEIKKDIFPNQRWIKTNKISYSGLPTVMKKIIKVAL